MTQSFDEWTLADGLDLLARLHRPKDRAYGGAWRKRGEVIAIFANIARKYDRLEVGLAEIEPAPTETLADTAADLCVYAGKYLTWLAETQPGAFAAVAPGADPALCRADSGPGALEQIFALLVERAGEARAPETVAEAWAQVQHAFGVLERGLMAQADPDPDPGALLHWAKKIELAWALTAASAWLLLRLGQRDPAQLQSVIGYVERMEGAAG